MRKIAGAAMSGIHDGAAGATVAAPTRKCAIPIGFCVAEIPTRSNRSPHNAGKAFKRKSEMGAALVWSRPREFRRR